MQNKTDVLIIGGGPGGSAAAMFLLREGINPIIVEQEEFPRFHIGESMTGESAALLRRLGMGDAMLERSYPVKHGVRVFGKGSWFIPVARRDENWELQPTSTWQVRRSDFDGMSVARSRGPWGEGSAWKSNRGAAKRGRQRARSDHQTTRRN